MNRSRLVLGSLLILIGVVFAADALGWWEAGDIAELIWPLALLGIGLTVMFHRRHPSTFDSEDVLQLTAVFSGRRAVCSSDPFHGAVAVAVFGGVDLDLRPAVLGPNAYVDATAVFGGVKLIVPPQWQVVLSGPAIFGGNENKTEVLGPRPAGAPTLHVRALSLFGGVEVQPQPSLRDAPGQGRSDVAISQQA